MSSFKRKSTGKPSLPVFPGTRISPASNLTLVTSTGISSLDDILGGGLPLSCSLVFAAPDIHSSYGDLIQKYFIAQGLVSGHRICVVGQDPKAFVQDVMWFPKSQTAAALAPESDDEDKGETSQKVKIAWRYEKMTQFKTTVGSDGESYCQTFELSSRVPEAVIAEALDTNRLHLVDVERSSLTPTGILGEITKYLSSEGSAPVRICIPSLGSPVWGDLTNQSIIYFLHLLRAKLREHGHGCASTSLAPELSKNGWGGLGWLEKVGWASDGLLTVSAFTGNPGLSSIFPSHHGLLQIHTLPSPHTASAPSDRFSTLRGLTSSGENNLAFKCTRKRLVFETLHLDVEGGTGERRTTASTLTVEQHQGVLLAAFAAVEVQLEGERKLEKKVKKSVAFQSDRPELAAIFSMHSTKDESPRLASYAPPADFHSKMPLTDPSHFPDPYPFRPPHHHLPAVPALSSTASSSASTRSSAYTSSGSALAYSDYSNVHVASGDDDHAGIGGITPDAVVQMLTNDPAQSASARSAPFRAHENSRWSESYSGSVRSRSSSIGNGNTPHDFSPPPLSQKPSYDVSWQTVDEKDEIAMTDEETDDEPGLDTIDDDPDDDTPEERTSAAVVADEGRGLIVQGDNVPIVQLQVQPGTTHLLIGSSTTPNAVPPFLTSVLPQIAHSLLALDISANFLGALPPVLAVCDNLEELNVASNPLRVLPVFLADLLNLRVLIADSTGISTLPDVLVDLDKLHTISIRRNKLHALPSWLCLLPALATLCVDGNPFQGPWKALVDPLLAKVPSTPVYPLSTPVMPLSAGGQSSNADTETDGCTDIDDFSDRDAASPGPAAYSQAHEDEDHTITPDRALLVRSTTSPFPLPEINAPPPLPKPLTRTRTTPNRNHFDQMRSTSGGGASVLGPRARQATLSRTDGPDPGAEHEVRKMKSAGDLRRGRPANGAGGENEMPQRPPMMHYPTSLSSSNLLSMNNGNGNAAAGPAGSPYAPPNSPPDQLYPKRFASLGPNSQLLPSPTRPPTNAQRPQLSKSMWDDSPGQNMVNETGQMVRSSSYTPAASQPLVPPRMEPVRSESFRTEPVRTEDGARQTTTRNRSSTRDKASRWGFLKKMSMGKMKPDSPSPSPATSPNPPRISRPNTSNGSPPSQFAGSISRRGGGGTDYERSGQTPQIDVRLSTSGMLDSFPSIMGQPSQSTSVSQPPSPNPPRQQFLKEPSSSSSHPPSTAASNGLLSPPLPQPRAAKRRSFLPVEAPGAMSLSIPENSAFVPNVVVAHDGDDNASGPDPARGPTPSPVLDHEQYIRREEDRARDAYMRALRSVMAYLKDMNDLGTIQQPNSLSMYEDGQPQTRSRRPTIVEPQREVSMASSGSGTMLSNSDSSGQLRSSDSIAGMRSGASSQTLSVATTDSSGSQEERKFKDDKGKRAMVIREIVVTERTYVKGLQELVDIYIKPASTPVNLLSGVGSSKDTVVPASERKVVFGGIDALFSFHNDSFLPALEGAAAPLMKPTAEVLEKDVDGQLSLEVSKAVGNIFVKHAAFMRMYSSYINNFDSSMQRVKYWSSDRNTPGSSSPGNALSPSSSSAQLVGLGISMAMTPNSLAEHLAAATGIPNLTTSQRKRIKSYLKRCRLNPRHTQMNLEGYLLLPVQRIPRYKLLLEELLRSTPPPMYEYLDDPLDRALAEIALLANNMNEGKRESESRRKLVQWQARIRGKFPSPLVQPHRRLIMDGPLLLTRVVRKAVVSFEAINAQGDASTVQVDCLAPELTPRPLVGILCNDLLVLCRDPSEGQDLAGHVDLWAVLRMQTLPQPASIVHGNALRLVDNKAILYFDAPTPSDALNWYRAINLHIPASKS